MKFLNKNSNLKTPFLLVAAFLLSTILAAQLSNDSGCDQTLTSSNGAVGAGLYQASSQITSSGTINSGEVVFKAGSQITLLPGFSASFTGTTGSFLATIENCETDCQTRDFEALEALYNSTNGADWLNKDNWLTAVPLNDWEGITTNSDGCVIHIRLSNNNLSGQIPIEIGNLRNLEDLFLNGNELVGSMPIELGDLLNLEILELNTRINR